MSAPGTCGGAAAGDDRQTGDNYPWRQVPQAIQRGPEQTKTRMPSRPSVSILYRGAAAGTLRGVQFSGAFLDAVDIPVTGDALQLMGAARGELDT
jgi:hypothetical protein